MGLEGRYTIVKKLADGGMAEIFLASQSGAEGFSRAVILKRILPAFSADPHFRNMLVDEAHIAMSLHHGNIVQVLDLGQADGRTFLVLELVDGWDLATILQRAANTRTPFPPGLALYITAEVCRALAYAHGKSRDGKPLGIVHRDISPQNVLISEQGEVKLADFGIAKARGKRERTQTGVIKGKIEFMSPEQASGQPLDARSDIFSVGTVLYLMATGRCAFDSASDLASLVKVQQADYPAPETVYPGISQKIARIIATSMQRPPAQRYRSAEEMMAAVEEVLRADFGSAGQSELKRWLEALARKDGAPTIARAGGVEGGGEKDELTGKTLALVDPARAVSGLAPTDVAPSAHEAPVARATTDVARSRRGLKVALGVGLAMGAGAFGLFTMAPRQTKQLVNQGEKLVERGTQAIPKAVREILPAPAPEPRRRRATADDARLFTVEVATDPPHATVRSARAVHGRTPLELQLPPGVHKLTFEKRGYSPITRTVTVGEDNPGKLMVQLEKSQKRAAR